LTEKDMLIVFTRYPMPGKVKTRLIPELGAERAADIHREMTKHLLSVAKDLAEENTLSVEIHFAGGNRKLMSEEFGTDLPYVRQSAGDLGHRMHASISRAFRKGMERVVLIGTDCPGIDREILLEAFEKLKIHDCVFGPAYDGGYYLIGLTKPAPALFEKIPWGDESALKKTIEIVRTQKLRYDRLKMLHDVDRPEDLKAWEEVKAAKSLQKISVIIPVLNEESNIAMTIESLRHAANIEIIVVDGGSTDATPDIARQSGVRVIRGEKGRAAQMNQGAMKASGKILLFIHGDTLVPFGYDREIREALGNKCVAAGTFSLRFDNAALPIRIIEKGANLRSRYLGLPYGDQGLFLSSASFRNFGGFPEMAIMEDVSFIRKIRAQGKIVTLDVPVTTSARRYETLGTFQTWAVNQCVLAGYVIGVSPDRIAMLYRSQHKGMMQWVMMVLCGLIRRFESSLHRSSTS
jgi:rSAM/selenodomain-associated transferase 2/rSAM/selenodomain-associated transferase 1